ncbi:MAG TPA: hypothetical protein VFV67_23640 [Actinophytocola sp.]|uniref:hypothetical protein n=1 Tax=Actinophytocola sp. TaxID=1872138 RepID=UPI002DBEA2B4|nr:hypothetical protein [Actinophytocola sp.]HEU5473651.1 hypothetical protein [Actinophytocola sp.]
MTKRDRILAMLGALVLAGASACGGDDASSGSGSAGSGGSSGDGGMTVSIAEPADGSSVQMPFQVKVDSSVELGPTESGKHHVHLFFDGDDKKYEVVESDTVEVTSSSKSAAGLSSGQHEMSISLRNADHSPAGAETKIMVEIGGSGGQPQQPTSGGDGY